MDASQNVEHLGRPGPIPREGCFVVLLLPSVGYPSWDLELLEGFRTTTESVRLMPPRVAFISSPGFKSIPDFPAGGERDPTRPPGRWYWGIVEKSRNCRDSVSC